MTLVEELRNKQSRDNRDLLDRAADRIEELENKQSEGGVEKTFYVIDNKTGKEADCEEIALTEEWAKGLIYCDMEGFALGDDGTLFLLDECGRFEYCPNDRFTVVFEKGGE